MALKSVEDLNTEVFNDKEVSQICYIVSSLPR